MSNKAELALRKELLLARAELERLELAESVSRIRASTVAIGAAKLAGQALSASVKNGRIWANALHLIQRYPAVASAGSLVVSRLKLGRVLKLAALGWAGWQLYQGVQQYRQERDS